MSTTGKASAKKADEKKDDTKAVAVAETGGAVANALPDYMKEFAGAGGENVDATKLEIPRITLLQALSKEVAENGLKAGQFYHTITEEELGEELEFVPILFRSQFILWNPRENGGGILARADDGKHWNPANAEFAVKIDKKGTTVNWKTAPTVKESGLDQWGTFDPSDPKSQPAATEMYSFLIAFPKRPDLGVAMLALQRSQVRVARKFLSALTFSQMPFFGQVFKMSSVQDTNKNNQTFNNFKFARAGQVDAEQFPVFAGYYKKFKDQTISVQDLEKMQDETPADTSGPEEQKDGKKEF